jgi:type II restriction/modification system DNA methylase subunit YeeA
VQSINADLTATVDITGASKLEENRNIAFEGDQKAGQFEIDQDTAHRWLELPLNPNGRPNSDVVRRWANGADIVRRPSNTWIIDFGVGMLEREAALYEAPYEHVLTHVKPVRATNKETIRVERWWQHARPRPEMRAAIESMPRFICTARVAKHRLFVWMTPDVLPDSATVAIARSDDYFFGVLHSRAHEVWSLRMGTSLEDRPRYTPTTCFETFPLPWPPGQEPTDDPRVLEIAAAAKELDEKRNAWLNPPPNPDPKVAPISETELKKRTLTNLYNARPAWLQMAHERLDRAVWSAYGWDDDPTETTEDELLTRLLTLNGERKQS